MKKIYHLEIKSTSEHRYYTSISALFLDNEYNVLGISKFTLDRYKFEYPFENDKIIIRKDVAKSTGDVSK